MVFLDLPQCMNRKKSMSEASDFSSGVWSDIPSETVIGSRINYGTKLEAMYGVFLEYTRNSSIHGLNYIFKQRRPTYERIYWTIFVIVSSVTCFFSIQSIYKRWSNYPIIIGYESMLSFKDMPVYEIPFPSIVICPQFKTDRRIFNFSDVYFRAEAENATFEELDILSSLLHVCSNPLKMNDVIQILQRYDFDDNSVDSKLQSVMVRHNETGIVCLWDNEFYLCEDIQRYVATDEGICYQFNGVDLENLYRNQSFYDSNIFRSDYHFEKTLDGTKADLALNYSEARDFRKDGDFNHFSKMYPKRTIGSTNKGYISVFEVHKDDFDYICQDGMQGHKIALFSPEDVPAIFNDYIFLPNDRKITLTVTPRYTVSSTNIEEFDPFTRNCFFDHERYLRFFKKYSQRNCEFECLTNFTISKCNCTTFYMPKVESVPVCGVSSIECYTEAQDEMQYQIYKETIATSTSKCNCLPGCTSLKFDFDISEEKYDLRSIMNEFYSELPRQDITGAALNVHFKKKQFPAIVQTKHYGTPGLIAYIGGTLTLYLGFSLLSLVEIIYFISIRLYFNIKQRQENSRKRKLFQLRSLIADHSKKY